MARIVDDDPPIKTGPANQAYKDGWDRIFGGEPEPAKATDAIEMRVKAWGYRCETCDKIVYDPENHQFHVIFKIEE